MEDWVYRALAKWPNVPALYGWLRLDRNGHWWIKGERIERTQIVDTINANYDHDEQGQWYFQNGPQRGYVDLDYTPLIVRVMPDDRLITHTGQHVMQASAAYLDEDGSILLQTEHGPALLDDGDLHWALERLSADGQTINETLLETALALPSGTQTALSLRLPQKTLPLQRLDRSAAPQHFGFIPNPAATEM